MRWLVKNLSTLRFGGSRWRFAADAEGYKYIVWVFNARFAISSLEPCQLPSFFGKESLGTAACYHSAPKNLAPAKTAAP